MLQTKANWQTVSLSIVGYITGGAIYGATWAVILLVTSAIWATDGVGPEWVEQIWMRATIGLWFGTLAGALTGLIGGLARLGIDIDTEPMSTLVTLLASIVFSVASVIALYSRFLDNAVRWLGQFEIGQMQLEMSGIAAGIIGLLLLLPAIIVLSFLNPSSKQ